MVGTKTFPLAVVLSAVDRVSAPLRQVTNQVGRLSARLTSVGKSLSVNVTAPLAALGGFAVRTGMNMERSFTRVRAVTGASAEEMTQLEAAVRGLPPDLGMQRGVEVLEGLAEEGFNARDALTALVPAAQLAKAANLEGGEAAALLADSLAAVGGSAADAQHLADLLTKATGGSSKMMKEYAQVLQVAGPGMRAAGMALEDQIAAISGLASVNLEGAAGVSALRAAVQSLESPSSKAIAVFERLGLTVRDVKDEQGNIRPLNGLLDKLRASGASAADFMEVFGRKTGLAFANIDPTVIERARDALKDVGGETGRRAAQMGEGAAGAWDRMSKSFGTLLDKIAVEGGLLDLVGALTGTLSEMIALLNRASPTATRWAVNLGSVAATAGVVLISLGKLGAFISWIGTTFSAVTPVVTGSLVGIKAAVVGFGAAIGATPIGWLIAGLAALGGAIYLLWDNWESVTTWMTRAWQGFMAPFRLGFEFLLAHLPSLKNLLPDFVINFARLTPEESGAATGSGATPAAALEAASNSSVVRGEAGVTVTFENLPPTARVTKKTDPNVDLDLNLGYAMGT